MGFLNYLLKKDKSKDIDKQREELIRQLNIEIQGLKEEEKQGQEEYRRQQKEIERRKREKIIRLLEEEQRLKRDELKKQLEEIKRQQQDEERRRQEEYRRQQKEIERRKQENLKKLHEFVEMERETKEIIKLLRKFYGSYKYNEDECPNCGKRLDDNDSLCSSCGAKAR